MVVRLQLPAVDPEAFKAVIQHAYTDDWGGNATLVLKIRRVAADLKMGELMTQLTKSVEENLSAADAVGVLQAAAEERDKHLMDAALEAVLGDPEEAINSVSVKFLLPQTLGSLVAREDFGAPELAIAEACLRWAAHRIGAEPGSDSAAPASAASAAGAGEGAGAAATAAPRDGEEDADAAAASAAAIAADAAAAAAGPVLTGSHPRTATRVPSDVVVGRGAELRAQLEPHVLPHIRFPLLKARDLATRVKPWGVLTASELVQLLAFQFRPREERRAQARVAKFLATPRSGATSSLLIHCWGGGGASGQDSGCARGGAGGYICVRYEAEGDDDELEIYVGEGGYADASGSTGSTSTKAWPNGGCGGYSWNSGGGGGATFVKSKARKGQVIVGAGGGGGGTAPRSWACGGGGGGGTKDGRVGEGGMCGNQPTPEGTEGTDGGGRGGKGDSKGSGKDGKNANGAGGGSGSSTSADGGDGGDASHKHSELVKRINASSDAAVSVTVGGRSRSAGQGSAAGKAKGRGSPGLVIIENEDSGTVQVFNFSAKGGKKADRLVHRYRVT